MKYTITRNEINYIFDSKEESIEFIYDVASSYYYGDDPVYQIFVSDDNDLYTIYGQYKFSDMEVNYILETIQLTQL